MTIQELTQDWTKQRLPHAVEASYQNEDKSEGLQMLKSRGLLTEGDKSRVVTKTGFRNMAFGRCFIITPENRVFFYVYGYKEGYKAMFINLLKESAKLDAILKNGAKYQDLLDYINR